MMDKSKSFHYALLAIFTLAALIHAQDQSDFISIDCGKAEGPDSTDLANGIKYTSDENFIDTGLSGSVDPKFFSKDSKDPFNTVRSFPEGNKNCYTLNPTQGKNGKYLIRAGFMYGNYDGENKTPQFDLYLGGSLWETIKLDHADSTSTNEIIHVPSTDYIFVCLINTGLGVPFISSLELRPLNTSLYKTENPSTESLALLARFDLGSNPDQPPVRYMDDIYDRIWTPKITSDWETLRPPLINNIDAQALNDAPYRPPVSIMTTAVKPNNDEQSLVFSCYLSADPNYRYYSYKYFAEIEILQSNQIRELNLRENGEQIYGPYRPEYLSTFTVPSGPLKAETIKIEITKTENSTLPPILNAVEVYRIRDFSQPLTLQNDVNAMMSIKRTYQVRKKDWQGDPCAPKNYSWEGINCSSYENNSPLRIISLNLSLSGLTGKITPAFADLASLQYLDLSYNSFSGSVPDFFSRMPSLRVLNLKGNEFTGSLPAELEKRLNNGSLQLRMDDLNQNNTLSPSSQNKNSVVTPLVAFVAATLSAVIIGLAIFCGLKTWRKNVVGKGEILLENQNDSFESKNRQYAYSDVIRITKNFTSVLGNGGFGTVYHGCIGDNEVAVKMLSPSSAQGYKEFHAEVSVQHSKTPFIMQITIMKKLTLFRNIAGKIEYILSWEERMRIAVDAAQGLEYLHNGCKPPMVHRDVKPSNILLNDKLQAKISDFGLSCVFSTESSTTISTAVAGTAGYLDPECVIMSNRLNEKSDVYSLGLVLLNIITGQPVVLKSFRNIHIIEWVKSRLAGGDIRKIVDPRLGDHFNINSAWKAVEVALACTSHFSSTRPTMIEVLMDLKECLAIELVQNNNEGECKVNSIVMDTETAPLAR
ncbi:senescence-induced receptor-like serine/threonine-protein kinase isoform X2 [Pistacia vera]|uniref:senescence-induced receptor-like serine/threonine-protein kinase isoform X2 n=1 Tax=Pistacia vera TaxID=55513 RepID=UPI0012630001|nr:senescence-induced receptor-like serine/threonine-protein kinase isoform X2 [Pistacia vera]